MGVEVSRQTKSVCASTRSSNAMGAMSTSAVELQNWLNRVYCWAVRPGYAPREKYPDGRFVTIFRSSSICRAGSVPMLICLRYHQKSDNRRIPSTTTVSSYYPIQRWSARIGLRGVGRTMLSVQWRDYAIIKRILRKKQWVCY